MVLILTHRLPADTLEASLLGVTEQLVLDAEERTRSRHHFTTTSGLPVNLRLPRGTVLVDGDWLCDEQQQPQVRVVAKAEPVLTVTAHHPLDLMRAAFHLGNRHVPLEISEQWLRLSPDSVLEEMLRRMGLQVTAECQPFHPETGAYRHSHAQVGEHTH